MYCPFIEIAGFCIDPFVATVAIIIFILGIAAFFIFSANTIEDQNTLSETPKVVAPEVVKEYYLLQRQVMITIGWKEEGWEKLTIKNYMNTTVTIAFNDQDADDITLPNEVEVSATGTIKINMEFMPTSFSINAYLEDKTQDETIEVERP